MKNVLLLGPDFFGYLDRINNALSKYYSVEQKYTFNPASFGNRLNKKNALSRYYGNLEVVEDVDIVLVINGRYLPSDYLCKIKKLNPKAQFVLYIWDDYKNVNHNELFLNCFDLIFTFSKNDSCEYNLIYQPFFYSEILSCDKSIGLSFVGSMHSNRLSLFNEISRKLDSNSFLYLYSDPISFIKNIKNIKAIFKIKFRKLQYNKYINILSKSKITLEIPHKNQKNITTRAIEVLGTQTKLITTSEKIKELDFYCSDNIFVLNNENLDQIISWSKIPYKKIDSKILKKYSLDTWCRAITSYE